MRTQGNPLDDLRAELDDGARARAQVAERARPAGTEARRGSQLQIGGPTATSIWSSALVSGDTHLTQLTDPSPPVLTPREFLEARK